MGLVRLSGLVNITASQPVPKLLLTRGGMLLLSLRRVHSGYLMLSRSGRVTGLPGGSP